MIPAAVSRLIILVLGALYPAYESYKTIRTRNIQRYVRWILYWIVYSLFICAETFADIFVSWLPFYYELKVVFVIWLVLPFSNGANVVFRYLIRPQFSKWEKIADHILATLGRESLSYVVVFVTRSLHYMVNFFIEIALMIHSKIADFVEHRKTGESREVATLTRDQRLELEVNPSTSTELRENAATGETQEVFVSASGQEYSDLGHLSEVPLHSSLTELRQNAANEETQEAMSASDRKCSNVEPQLEIELSTTSGELPRNAVTEETQEMIVSTSDRDCSDVKPQVEVEEVILLISDKEVNKIKPEPENELFSSITRRKRKATGRKMKKMEVDVAQWLPIESEQLSGEVSIRTTRAKKYVCCSSQGSA